MRYHTLIDINESRINYELKVHGSAVVGVPKGASEQEIDDAIQQLKSRYKHVEVDCDGDLIVSD